MIKRSGPDKVEDRQEGGKVLQFKPVLVPEEVIDETIEDSVAKARATVSQAYSFVLSGKSAKAVRGSSLEKMEARKNAMGVLKKTDSGILVDGSPCKISDLLEIVLKKVRGGVGYFEVQISWEEALGLGNFYLEGDYNLDVFVESFFIEMLGKTMENRLDNSNNLKLSLEYGDIVRNEDGVPKSREFYVVHVRNLNARFEEVSDE